MHDDVAPRPQLLHEVDDMRRAGWLEKDMRAFALGRPRRDGVGEGLPGGGEPAVKDSAPTGGIVETEKACLLERSQRPLACGMRRVALDLRGPSFVALDHHADAVSPERHRRGVARRHARSDLWGLPHVRHDVLLRPAAARLRSRDGRHGARGLQEAAPGEGLRRNEPIGRRPRAVRHRWHPVHSRGGLT